MAIGKGNKTGSVGKPARMTGPIGRGGRSSRHNKKDVDYTTQKVYAGYGYPTTTTTTSTTVTTTSTTTTTV